MDQQPSSFFRLVLKYIHFFFTAGHRRGQGIHSPYVYTFIRKVLYNEDKLPVPEGLGHHFRKLEQDHSMLTIQDPGAGSRIDSSLQRSVSSFAKKSSVTMKQGALLFRLCKWFMPDLVIEFGTGVGLSTACFAAGANGAHIITIEGSRSKSDYAKKQTPVGKAGEIKFLRGHFDDHFSTVEGSLQKRTLVFIDGDHRYKPTIDKVTQLLKSKNSEELIILLDDIYWSRGMEAAWLKIVKEVPDVITADLFRMGIIFNRKGIVKQHFKIKY